MRVRSQRWVRVSEGGSDVSLKQNRSSGLTANHGTQPGPTFSKRRQDLVRNAVDGWVDQLVDLGGRNNLLYYRDLTRGTLDLTTADVRVCAELLQGKTVRLGKLFSLEDARKDAARRVRTIRGKAQENFEERGLQTLYLAAGMASWETNRGSAKP